MLAWVGTIDRTFWVGCWVGSHACTVCVCVVCAYLCMRVWVPIFLFLFLSTSLPSSYLAFLSMLERASVAKACRAERASILIPRF